MARSRSRARISRPLIAFLVIALVLGIVFQVHKVRQSRAAAAQQAQLVEKAEQAKIALAASLKPIEPVPVSSGSSAAPSKAPAALITSTPSSLSSAAGTNTAYLPGGSTLISPTYGSPATQPTRNVTQVAFGSTTQPSASSLDLTLPVKPTLLSLNTMAARPLMADSTTTLASAHPIQDGKAKLAAGDLLDARRVLNDALRSGQLSESDAASAKSLIAEINKTVVFAAKRFPSDPFGGTITVKPGQRLSQIAAEHDVTWELLLRLNGMNDPKKLRAGQAIKILKGPMHAVVSKSKFTMDIYLGSPQGGEGMYVTTFNVGLGRDDSTPTGTWMIEPHHKIKHPTYYSPRGEGVIAADDPKNPLGDYWLGLSGTDGQAVGKASYGIHGTIEPDSIGKMSSMGCIRLRNEEIAVVWELLVEGKSTVLVKD